MKKRNNNDKKTFSYQWLKICYFEDSRELFQVKTSLPKKYIPRAVDRNKIKRWIRVYLRNFTKRGYLFIYFLEQPACFYKQIKKKDFDHVLSYLIKKIDSTLL